MSPQRPRPTVSCAPATAYARPCSTRLIAVTQRDDTLLMAPAEARRLAHELLRAADGPAR